jgi:hypothetical protein
MRAFRPPGLVVATVLLMSLSGCAAATSSEGPAPGPSARATSPSTPAREVSPAERATSVPEPEAPSLAVLPSGRQVPVSTVGTTAAGTLAVPDDIDVAGWWRGGSRIGDPFGSVLVAAHVDSRTQGLGPFAELLTVTAGSRIRLESDGLRQAFEVRSRRLVPQGTLADDSWIFDAAGDLRLTLVTCAPPYDSSRGGYQNLAVVTARPLGPPEATS